MLADTPHLPAWGARNIRNRPVVGEIFDGAKLLHDEATNRHVACWEYENAATANGLVWRARERDLRPLSRRWRHFFD